MKSISSFWNSLTTNDRHAEKRRSSYNPSFTSIRTGLVHTDSSMSVNKASPYSSVYGTQSPNASQVNLTTGYTGSSTGPRTSGGHSSGGMQLQDFENGVAPPPPVSDSWRRIDHWAEENYPELYDQLSYGATQADVDELEHELEMTLPGDVRESLFIHDGQERGGRPTGLFFGVALLDCEELVDEYNLWRKVAASLPRPDEYPMLSKKPTPSMSSSQLPPASGTAAASAQANGKPETAQQARRPRQQRQGSRPEGACQPVYSHPGWIPLAKDYMGNNIAIDLAPGPQGKWGQVILFGRECDIKYVVAPSWASFLSMFVNDLESPNVVMDEDVGVGGEMGQLRLVLDQQEEHSYMEILKARVRRRERAIRGLQGGHDANNNNKRNNGKSRAVSPGKPRSDVNGRLPRSSLGVERNSTDVLLASPVVSEGQGVKFHEKQSGSLLSPALPVPASPVVQSEEAASEHKQALATEDVLAAPIVSGDAAEIVKEETNIASNDKDTSLNVNHVGTELMDVSLDDQA
ncbi:hypothetical protein BCR37DRAFT_377189 [Protomyces lactucae-debilis]|uniref:Knr4/Smi1-like domain-containing protein n=1 Tax=Protomyces lactucae-debilis TaxID=2754530 RepID=A0A1Y2FNC1_PROLT|nr:uncharacterized protein BCR37DRAFT_377189 [Protomyces lactucae-debilis]ORY85510.1 hypothetical protein BCR37DRAFT_377189 [Protomyces lactucae-debilis]